MSINSQQAKVITQNVATLVAAGGRVGPTNIGEGWSERQCRWDVRNAQLNTRDWEATLANLTYLSSSGYRGKVWHPTERMMRDNYMSFSEWKDAERRLEELQAPGSLAHPEGVLRVAYDVDRLKAVYEGRMGELHEAQEAVGWELFSHPPLVF